MITINQEKCIECRQCESICHTNSIRIDKNKVFIDKFLCSTCTQCIAVCPLQALSWDNIAPQNINNAILPKPEQIKEFLKQRRSVRKFKDKPIERSLLEDIAVMSKYAPAINSADKIKIERTLNRGSIFQNAPALIILVADKRIPHTELSSQYSLYNMALYSQTLGLGSCISGAGKNILSRNKKVKKLLNLPEHKDIQGILFLGYRNVNFKNKVEGIKPKIQWNSNIEGNFNNS